MIAIVGADSIRPFAVAYLLKHFRSFLTAIPPPQAVPLPRQMEAFTYQRCGLGIVKRLCTNFRLFLSLNAWLRLAPSVEGAGAVGV